ncbi:MAG: hypothetical protein M3478_10855 [Planctomycetota bacterium]|nr:hypothetical protein [Planctomycetota bacterium]
MALPHRDPSASVLAGTALAGTADGFISMPLAATHDRSPSTAPEDADLVAPRSAVQPAVIPLPSPLYAALALLGVALVARRAILRSC